MHYSFHSTTTAIKKLSLQLNACEIRVIGVHVMYMLSSQRPLKIAFCQIRVIHVKVISFYSLVQHTQLVQLFVQGHGNEGEKKMKTMCIPGISIRGSFVI